MTAPTCSASARNSAPTVDTVTVTHSLVISDVLTCSATASDEDDDEPTITYAWSGLRGRDLHHLRRRSLGSEMSAPPPPLIVYGEAGIGTASTAHQLYPTVPDTVTVTPDSGQVGDVLTCSPPRRTRRTTSPPSPTHGRTALKARPTPSPTPISSAPRSSAPPPPRCYGETGIGTASATSPTLPTVDTVTVTPDSGQVGDVLLAPPPHRMKTTTSPPSPTHGRTALKARPTPSPTPRRRDRPAAMDAYGETGIGGIRNSHQLCARSGMTISPDLVQRRHAGVRGHRTDADGSEPTITYEWTGGATGADPPASSQPRATPSPAPRRRPMPTARPTWARRASSSATVRPPSP